MTAVYHVNDDGTSTQLTAIHAKNEDRDLQRVLDNNLDLLPGDQIRPEDPCPLAQYLSGNEGPRS